MPNFIIRKAGKNDMAQVLLLIKELAAYEKEPDAVEVTVEDLQRDGFGKNPLFDCFVAENEEGICGMALVYFRYSTWKGKSLHLEDLYVKESERGTGLGKALYRKTMEFAKENNARRVEWEVLDWNENAIRFYEKSGARVLKGWYLAQMDGKSLDLYLSKKKVCKSTNSAGPR